MPETTVNKDDNFLFYKYDIGFPGEIIVNPISPDTWQTRAIFLISSQGRYFSPGFLTYYMPFVLLRGHQSLNYYQISGDKNFLKELDRSER